MGKMCSIFSSDAISVLNSHRPSPMHMLGILRELPKNKINSTVSVITDSIGIERSTSSLLSRMFKSTLGLSELVEGGFHSKIISVNINILSKIHYSLIAIFICVILTGIISKKSKILIGNQS
ncbi:MAG: hypothetical protein CM1200mP23_0130 [Nitrososphaerota archaeon]|nr:MAG: hypothetical protein CM1200mP23_0130 [Nitrososphaerota archaeon]